jgi:hypothetical protein
MAEASMHVGRPELVYLPMRDAEVVEIQIHQ